MPVPPDKLELFSKLCPRETDPLRWMLIGNAFFEAGPEGLENFALQGSEIRSLLMLEVETLKIDLTKQRELLDKFQQLVELRLALALGQDLTDF